jgi:RHS repeat-associated protein
VASGKVVRLAYPSGNRIAIAYGANGKVSSLTLEAAGSSPAVILSELQYEPFGPPRAWKWGGAGGTYLRKFDGHGRLAQYPLGNLHSGGVVRSVDYDESGRIRSYMHTSSLEVTAQASRLDQFFTYDSLDRLRAFQAADTSQAFEYDANGNRTRATFGNTSYTNLIAPNSNRLSSASGPAPAKFNSYDASGNLVSNGERIFKYDERGRLASVRTGLSTVSYSYNGIGERIQKSGPVSLVPGGVNQYFYDLAGNMLGEYDAAGRVVEETIFLEGVPVAVLKGVANSETHSPKLFHVFADHLGAPRVITDAHDGKIVWRWDKADPFGMALPLENIEMGRPFTYNRRFPGQYCDRESNLHYNYYRDYDPQTGRYIESDPIGLEGGINTYTYVGGNPIQRVDYKGESWGAVVPAILVGYAWYEFSKAEREGEKSSAAYVAAEAAYNACLKRMASGVNCNCQLELNAKNAAYLDLVGNALEAGKAANGLFRSKLPVGPTGNIPRPTAD